MHICHIAAGLVGLVGVVRVISVVDPFEPTLLVAAYVCGAFAGLSLWEWLMSRRRRPISRRR
jgi:hypothetical protein